MGNEENDTPIKTPKAPSTQEQPPPSSPATVFPDWSPFQAYYNSAGTPQIPPPGFFHSPVASSPQAHPFMWGQHMIPPPYGTPPPPYVMYPHGGVYAHPSMPPGSHPYTPYAMLSPNGAAEPSVATSGKESETKSGESKKKNLKRSKGSLGSLNMITGKDNETGKASGPASNGGISQSGESGGENSSEGSDANSQNDSQHSGKGSADGGTQNGGNTCSVSSGVSQSFPSQGMVNPPPCMVMTVPPNSVASPATNLNIGMDYWGGATPPNVATGRAKLPTIQPPGAIVPSNSIPSDLWVQDERELKRQRRKQSNRESARRSRLRKQAEYDELAQRVEVLKDENSLLREELTRVREECAKLTSENASLNEKLQTNVGEDSRVNGVTTTNGGEPEAGYQVAVNVETTEKKDS
ncbi:hypothetical protein ACHQM5_005588 [Ranunculus cassubicifolius]